MPIVISRTGAVLQAPILSQEQKDKAWETLTRGWASSNQIILKQLQDQGAKFELPTAKTE